METLSKLPVGIMKVMKLNVNKTQDLKNVPTKNTSQNLKGQLDQTNTLNDYSTVTDFAKFLG